MTYYYIPHYNDQCKELKLILYIISIFDKKKIFKNQYEADKAAGRRFINLGCAFNSNKTLYYIIIF